MPKNEKLSDDLTEITGLGIKAEQWLADRFAVNTFSDLSAISADDIYKQAQADSKRYSQKTIKLWTQQAAMRAAQVTHVVKLTSENSIESDFPPKVTVNSGDAVLQNNTIMNNEDRWEHIADFTVELMQSQGNDVDIEHRTILNHMEADKWEILSGIEPERIGQWILEQVSDKLRVSDADTGVPGNRKQGFESLIQLSMNIKNIHIYQPSGEAVHMVSGADGRHTQGTIQASIPFDLVTEIELGGDAATSARKLEIPYQFILFSQNRDNGEKVHLGDSELEVFSSAEVTYSPILRGIVLPVGTYRLRILVMAQSADEDQAYFELPTLNVV